MDRIVVGLIACLMIVLGALAGHVMGKGSGAIAAHKGEIVCVELAFEPSRWECGGL